MKMNLKCRHYCEVMDSLDTEHITLNLDQFFGGDTTYINIRHAVTCQVCGEDQTVFFMRDDGAAIPMYQYPDATITEMIGWTSW